MNDNDEIPADGAAWAARLDAGPLNRAEAERLQAWLDAAPGNEASLEEYLRLHGRAGAVLPAMVAAGRIEAPAVPRPAWWRPVWAGAALAAALAVAAGLFFSRPVSLATEAAQRQSTLLADGTRAELNAHTELEVTMRADARRVRLAQGEAFFAVAKDPARPFVVETAAGRVRVTGTVFNVRADTADSLQVTVIEGSVEVTPAAGGRFDLQAGDAVAVRDGRAEQRHLEAAALGDALAWREGRIVFDNVRLDEALARVGRFHGREIGVSAGAGELRLGGRFPLDDLDGFLRDLELALPVRVLRDARGGARVVPR